MRATQALCVCLAMIAVQLVERRVSDRKVADSRFDSRTGDASLCR